MGKKTAQKIILELKGKLRLDDENQNHKPANNAAKEAEEALRGLGFSPSLVADALQTLKSDNAEDIIRQFLSIYGK